MEGVVGYARVLTRVYINMNIFEGFPCDASCSSPSGGDPAEEATRGGRDGGGGSGDAPGEPQGMVGAALG